MKNRIIRILVLTLMLSALVLGNATAADTDSVPLVRVNGNLVEFPDEQPYLDNAGRIMVPIRFVTEELGADVVWDSENKAAHITKGTISVSAVVGSCELTVCRDDECHTVVMDTTVAMKNGRTFVPVRYIAEAIGATVDFSETYNTVGIYADILTAEQISRLREYDYTQPEGAVSYETYKIKRSREDLNHFYGTDRDAFGNFANAREHLYHSIQRNGTYHFDSINKTIVDGGNDLFYKFVVEEAISEIEYCSERVAINFVTDESCIYQADDVSGLNCAVRGIIEAQIYVDPYELSGEELVRLCKLGFSHLERGTVMRVDVDVHMSTSSARNINCTTIVPLCVSY